MRTTGSYRRSYESARRPLFAALTDAEIAAMEVAKAAIPARSTAGSR